jgi:predicted site-specific integrase-resolvase
VLKALHGKQEKVVQAIAMILDCDKKSCTKEGAVLENASVEEVVAAMEDRSSSHLMEVIEINRC